MADFRKAWAKTSKIEGGYVHDPADTGGETYKGVARNKWPKWEGWAIIDKVKTSFTTPFTSSMINAELAKDTALQLLIGDFYKVNYWDPLVLDAESSQIIAEKVFDIAVNMGVSAARTFYDTAKKEVDKA